MKPFKPPTIVSRPARDEVAVSEQRPQKRRRISPEGDQEATLAAANALKKPAVMPSQKFQRPTPRKPLASVPTKGVLQNATEPEQLLENYFTVLWRKFTTKKNKTWDGDGVLSIKGTAAVLQDISGRELGRGTCKSPLLIGSELSLGGREVEVEAMIPRDDYISGRVFLNVKKSPPPSLREVNGVKHVTVKQQAQYKKLAATQKDRLFNATPSTKAAKAGFKAPLMHNTVQPSLKHDMRPTARHDPLAKDALVMKRPELAPKGKQIVDVVVDPLLTRNLRPHQREGVAFMYECVMGMKAYDGEGAILADEMGLGKTLQTIALIWTLLKQNPIAGAAPIIKKALIVCPVSLIMNWFKEFKKWLGNERIGVFLADNDPKMRLKDFTKGKTYNVMIIGYERLTKVKNDLQGCSDIDIVICDEGHRLKTAANKAANAIKSLSTERRIILSGTPVQNDLGEFFTMVDFVNPNILSKYTTFKREFETPIIKGRQPGASAKDLENGEARSSTLAELTGQFILRRTAEILDKYLPQKTEYVVFCRPTKAQKQVYRYIVDARAVGAAMKSPAVMLELIMILKKVCNSPSLLLQTNNKGEEIKRPELIENIPRQLLSTPGASGKLQVLDELLVKIKNETDEKVVLVSNYTSTLDVLAKLLTSLGMSFLRLDGSVAQNKRQPLVDRFNKSPQSNSFVFLLSAKAGATGLNLIGASRLILYDLDWNPATCAQAMARIHRDGQKRPCFIYRFITQGAIDEKIYQRQLSKTGLADSIVDGKAGASGFTQDELRDLFNLDEDDECQTHKLLGCTCGGNGLPVIPETREEFTGTESTGVVNEDGVEILELDHSEDEEAPKSRKSWRSLKELKREEGEASPEGENNDKVNSPGQTKMMTLMQYTHFDTSRAKEKAEPLRKHWDDDDEDDQEDEDDLVHAESGADSTSLYMIDAAIEDTALKNVIRDCGPRIGFVLTKIGTVKETEAEKQEGDSEDVVA
jgi:DNA repair and recombination protein RAD54B